MAWRQRDYAIEELLSSHTQNNFHHQTIFPSIGKNRRHCAYKWLSPREEENLKLFFDKYRAVSVFFKLTSYPYSSTIKRCYMLPRLVSKNQLSFQFPRASTLEAARKAVLANHQKPPNRPKECAFLRSGH